VRRPGPLAALVLLLALGAAACGGGGGGDGDNDVASVSGDEGEQAASDEGDEEEQLIEWAGCMRDNGIDIPDPTRDADGNLVIEGNGIHIGGGEASGGIAVEREASDEGDEPEEPPFGPEEMEAATEECGPPPGIGPSEMSEAEVAEMQEQALAFAQCMRDEGIEDFPDPDFSEQGPGGEPQTRESGGDDEDGDGEVAMVAGPFGEIDLSDPENEAAFEACRETMGMEDGPGGGPMPAGGGEGDR
jgi:hypothetical protein